MLEYQTLNDFFTRELKASARPLASDTDAFVSPVDGCISQSGRMQKDSLLQAKGRSFTAAALLGDSHTSEFNNGNFATIYLSPKDYHRIHMPIDGTLIEMTYIPGRLFSVAPFCVNNVDAVFARNERVVCIFSTAIGKLALVLVGAINVAAIETVWGGLITPKKGLRAFSKTYAGDVTLKKGEEMGRFNMGSTVILISEAEALDWNANINPEAVLQMGQAMARCNSS